MNTFLILLALGYVSSEKLDLTYLPPPGSQYAGGRPEDIQFPLEFPKETYSTTLRPQIGNNRGIINPEDYKATVGIDRGVPPVSQDTNYVAPGSTPITEFQNTYKLPTTTVSYAFTQTTTHPPIESFETTIGPQFIGDYPTPGSYNIPSQEAYPTHEENNDSHISPGYKQIINKFGPQPTSGSVTVSTPSLDSLLSQKPENIISDHLNFASPGQFAGYPTHSTRTSADNIFRQKYPEGQQDFNQPQPEQQRPSTDRSGTYQSQFRNQNLSKGFEGTTIAPQGSFPTSQSSGILPNGDGFSIVPGTSTILPTISQSIFPGSQASEGGFQPSIADDPRFQLPTYPQLISNGPLVNQQPYGSEFEKQSGKTGYRQKVIQPYSTSTPTSTDVGVSDEQVSSGTFNTPGLYSTTSFPNKQYQDNQEPSSGYDNVNLPRVNGERGNIFGQPSPSVEPIITTGSVSTESPDIDYPTSTSNVAGSQRTPVFGARPNSASSTYRERPKNPQAEADHNAVILNYENVITPKGFAYTFDTSNGIHADESGTATDGVKAKGSYSYIGDDGKAYSVVYTADENGFRPYGDHLPTSPPVPEAIQRILEKVEEEKKAGISHDGFYDEEKYGHKKYQSVSAVSRNPQQSSKNHLNGALISQVGQNRPLIFEEESSDFIEANPEQNISEGYEITSGNKEIQTVGQISTQRPSYPVTEKEYAVTVNGALPDKNDENYTSNQGSYRPFVETSPRRPVIQSVRKQNSNINVPNLYEASFQGDNIESRPIVKAPFLQGVSRNQKYNEYNRKKQPENERYKYKDSSAQSEENQYKEKETTLPVNYEDKTGLRQPSVSGTIRRPITNIVLEKEKTENTYNRPGLLNDKVPIRRPNNEVITENYPGFYNNRDDFSKQPAINVNTRPSDYNSEVNYESSSSTTVKPNSVTRLTSMFAPGDQNGLVRRQPVSNRVSNTIKTDKNNEYQLVDNKTLKDSRVDNKSKSQYDNNSYSTPSSIFPSKTNGQYEPENELVGDNQRPSIKFGQKIFRPIVNKQTGLPENRNIVNRPSNESGYQYIPPQRKFEQDEYRRYPNKLTEDTRVESTRKPTQHLAGLKNKQATSKPFMTPNVSFVKGNAGKNDYIKNYRPNQTGTSPNNDIHQSSGNQFDRETSEYPESGTTSDQIFSDEIISSTKQPGDLSSTYRPIHQQTTSTPQYYHDEYTQQIPGFTRQGAMQRVSSKPGNRFYEDNGFNTKTPYPSSTARVPSARPYGPPEEVTRPGPNNFYHSGDVNYKNGPSQGFMPSTTPFPSQRTKIGGSYSEGTIKPQLQITFRPTETIRPTSEYSDETEGPRLPTVAPTYAEVTFGPGSTQNTQNEGNLPSTTYRPNYTVAVQNKPISTENSDDFLVDRYGRPIVRPGPKTEGPEEYASREQNEPSSSLRPILDQFGRPIESGYQQTPSFSISSGKQQGIVKIDDQGKTGPVLSPGEQYGQQKNEEGSPSPNGHEKYYQTRVTEPTRPFGSTLIGQQKYQGTPQYQPSTERILGEDFSGSKQQQKFDPETGYYY